MIGLVMVSLLPTVVQGPDLAMSLPIRTPRLMVRMMVSARLGKVDGYTEIACLPLMIDVENRIVRPYHFLLVLPMLPATVLMLAQALEAIALFQQHYRLEIRGSMIATENVIETETAIATEKSGSATVTDVQISVSVMTATG